MPSLLSYEFVVFAGDASAAGTKIYVQDRDTGDTYEASFSGDGVINKENLYESLLRGVEKESGYHLSFRDGTIRFGIDNGVIEEHHEIEMVPCESNVHILQALLENLEGELSDLSDQVEIGQSRNTRYIMDIRTELFYDRVFAFFCMTLLSIFIRLCV
jgi:hypothetical protein